MRLDRLKECLRVNEELVKDEEFDMGMWKCGTVGCLIGNYIAHAKPGGLTLVAHPFSGNLIPVQDGEGYVDALVIHFAMEFTAAKELFSPSEDDGDYAFASRTEACARLRAFIEDHSK